MRMLATILFVLLPTIGFGGEYQEKPVMCGPEEEIFPILRDKDETLLVAGKQLTKVRTASRSIHKRTTQSKPSTKRRHIETSRKHKNA